MQKHQNFIKGQWLDPLSEDWFENKNPANGEILGLFPRSGPNDIDIAVKAAKAAQKEWKNIPGPKRAEYLLKAADFLSVNKESFARDLCSEMGKVLDECYGDIQETIDMAVFCAGEGRRSLGITTNSEIPDRTVFSERSPIGVVGAITPWNYPMAMPAWKVMPALITGNAVVLKPAEDTPQSAVNFVKAFEYAGLPEGVLNLVNGFGEEAGWDLVNHREVNLISFTGSTDVGTKIAQQCPSTFKRVSLEMGGKNVVIILKDCDLNEAISGIIKSVFATSGQRCTSAGRIIIEKDVYNEVISGVLEKAKELVIGSGFEEETDIGPIINENQLIDVHKDVLKAIKQGGKLLCGGRSINPEHMNGGYFYEPTLITNVNPQTEIAKKETFGPVALIFQANDLSHAIEIANDIPYGLSAGIFTNDINKVLKFKDDIEAGAIFVNAACVGAEIQLPFGGMKGSGNGRREGAHHMLDIYTEWKSVSIQQLD
jgi:aldehyde dehydrogenase (NAD+)